LVLPEAPPDHSTISRTRRLIDLETHEAVFTWILQRLADAGLVKGKTIGIDATTFKRMPHCAASCGATPAPLTGIPDAARTGVRDRNTHTPGLGAHRPEAARSSDRTAIERIV
jgi:hypothetical protein